MALIRFPTLRGLLGDIMGFGFRALGVQSLEGFRASGLLGFKVLGVVRLPALRTLNRLGFLSRVYGSGFRV